MSDAEDLVQRAALRLADLADSASDLSIAKWAMTAGLRAVPEDHLMTARLRGLNHPMPAGEHSTHRARFEVRP